jgi:hypothetical protein
MAPISNHSALTPTACLVLLCPVQHSASFSPASYLSTLSSSPLLLLATVRLCCFPRWWRIRWRRWRLRRWRLRRWRLLIVPSKTT